MCKLKIPSRLSGLRYYQCLGQLMSATCKFAFSTLQTPKIKASICVVETHENELLPMTTTLYKSKEEIFQFNMKNYKWLINC